MYDYEAKLIKVVDGDTIDVHIDLGFSVWTTKRLRFARIDAYESRTRDLEEKKLGLAAKQLVIDELENADKILIRVTEKGKFGRWIAEINIINNDKIEKTEINNYMDALKAIDQSFGTNLNDLLVEKKLAIYKEY